MPGGTFSWKDSSTVPTVTNDGYAVTFTPTDRNYAAVDGVAGVTVAPKELTLPGFAAQPRVYTPGDTSVDYTVGALSGLESGFRDVIVDITGITAQLDSPDQGERIVTLSGDLKLIGSHAENYTLRQPDNLRVTISKRAYDSGYGFTISELSDQPYTGKPVTPIPEIKYGDTPLIEGTDFELSYVNNVLAGPQPVLTIKFQGNYTGQKSMSFSIFNTPLPRDQFETVFGVSDSDLRSWHKQDIVLTGIAPWSIGQTLAEIDSNQITLQNEGRECTDGFYCKKEGSDILDFATVVYSLDKTGPEITSAEVSTTKWTNQAVTVTITASDRLSRLAGEAYSFDGGRTWQKEPMKAFSQDTVLMPQTLCVRDTAGNVSQYPSPVTISNIDTDLPTVSVEPSPDPQKWYGKTVFTVTARDNKSGVQSTVVSEGDLDGVPVLDGTFTAEPAQAGTYTYTVTVTDKADNTKSQQVTVQIDPIIDTFAALVQDLNGESELAALLSALDSHAAYTNDQKQHIENSVQGMAALQKLQQAFSDKQDALLLELNTILQRYPDEISISDIDRAETLYKLLDSEHLAQIETLEIYQQLLLDRQQAQLALEQLNTASQDDAGYEQKQTAQNTYDSLSPAQKNLVEKQAPGAQELLNTDLEAGQPSDPDDRMQSRGPTPWSRQLQSRRLHWPTAN